MIRYVEIIELLQFLLLLSFNSCILIFKNIKIQLLIMVFLSFVSNINTHFLTISIELGMKVYGTGAQ